MSPAVDDDRPRRSALYMPGANERALAKAPTLATDAVILDLEDAVAPAAKPEARERVCDLARRNADRELFGSREVTVRVNARGTEWHDADLAAVARAGPDAVVVPKVDSAAQVEELERALAAAGAPDHLRLWAMLETPRAVLRAAEIAEAGERLSVLVMGTNDLAAEQHAEATHDREALLPSLTACVLAARSAGRAILDGVYNAVADADGFAAECRQGRRLGFDGKTLIHPGQLETANATFAPSPEQVGHARRVIEAFEEAEAAGSGVVTVDGVMVENLHVRTARRVLALDRAIAER